MKSPFLLAFLLSLSFIYLLANWKISFRKKLIFMPILSSIAGILGSIAYSPEDFSWPIFSLVAVVNLFCLAVLYPFLASRFAGGRSDDEKRKQQEWIDANFKNKKKK